MSSTCPSRCRANSRLEARFGFNTTTLGVFIGDLIKQTLLAVLIGAPLLLAVLWLMAQMGARWWLYVWAFWMSFNLLALLLYPTLISPPVQHLHAP